MQYLTDCRNRLEQVKKLYDYLQENFNFFMRGGEISYSAGSRDFEARVIIGCNFRDLQRYLTLDHIKMSKEKPVYFLKEMRKTCCGSLCRIDGEKGCYCNGQCHTKDMCAWLRHEKGQPYCFLVNPWRPEIIVEDPFTPEKPWPWEKYREHVIQGIDPKNRRLAERLMTMEEPSDYPAYLFCH